MPISAATENLSFSAKSRPGHGLSNRLLRLEAWLDARASARALYRLDDAALSDIALSRSDVERVNVTSRWPFLTIGILSHNHTVNPDQSRSDGDPE